MKFLSALFFLLTSVGLSSLSAQQFVIQGWVDSSLKIEQLYFAQASFSNGTMPKAQKVQVMDGKFQITGSLNEPAPAFLSLTENLQPKNPDEIKQFVLDNGTITITVNDKISSAQIIGSAANDDITRYTQGQAPFLAKLTALNEAAQTQMNRGLSLDSVAAMYQGSIREANAELTAYQTRFLSSNPRAFISLLLVPEVARVSHDYFAAEKMFLKLDPSIIAMPSAGAIKSFIEAEKKTSVGANAPDFALPDTAGRSVTLSSLRGKYVLLDFWAAWCGPCRQENPNVVKNFEKYKNKKFTVLGVSLDRDRKDWLKAIATDGLKWAHISDLKYFGSSAAVLYRVGSIPRNFLIDPKGKIIARDLRGPDLGKKLEEVLKDL